MICKQCGNTVSDNGNFCNRCGAKVEQKQTNHSKKIVWILFAVFIGILCVSGFLYITYRNNELKKMKNNINELEDTFKSLAVNTVEEEEFNRYWEKIETAIDEKDTATIQEVGKKIRKLNEEVQERNQREYAITELEEIDSIKGATEDEKRELENLRKEIIGYNQNEKYKYSKEKFDEYIALVEQIKIREQLDIVEQDFSMDWEQDINSKIIVSEVGATDSLTLEQNRGKTACTPQMIFDGRSNTCWSPKGRGIGACIWVPFSERVSISGFDIIAGYDKISSNGKDRFWQNHAPREINIYGENGKKIGSWQLERIRDWQRVDFGRTIDTQVIIIEIVSIYEGDAIRDDDKDNCISEISFW